MRGPVIGPGRLIRGVVDPRGWKGVMVGTQDDANRLRTAIAKQARGRTRSLVVRKVRSVSGGVGVLNRTPAAYRGGGVLRDW